jgi:hypothetical protein
MQDHVTEHGFGMLFLLLISVLIGHFGRGKMSLSQNALSLLSFQPEGGGE